MASVFILAIVRSAVDLKTHPSKEGKMISYEIYRLAHFGGIFLMFMALGIGAAIAGRSKVASICHGVGLTLVLVGGFGMLARLQISWPFPGWALIKVGVWVLFGGAMVLLRRKILSAPQAAIALTLLGLISAYAAIYKPFLE